MNYKWFWHVHHDMLLEPLTRLLKKRIDYIKENKPKKEIALRLKLIKPVKGKLPRKMVEAWEARDKAWDAWEKAWKTWDKAKSDAHILALHKKECPNCSWNGQTILTKK